MILNRNFLKGETNQQLRGFLESLHAETDDNSGVFGNAWSQTFVDIWNSECECKICFPILFDLLFFISPFFFNMHLSPPETDSLVGTLRNTDLATDFPTCLKVGNKCRTTLDVGGITSQLKLIARLISIRNERGNGINRDVFYCEMGGEFT